MTFDLAILALIFALTISLLSISSIVLSLSADSKFSAERSTPMVYSMEVRGIAI